MSLLGGRVVVVVETNLGFAGQGRLPGGHKGRCSKRSKRVRARHAEAGCYIRGRGCEQEKVLRGERSVYALNKFQDCVTLV